jgi:hypothetical protein
MTDVYEFSENNRNNLIYNYIVLTPEEALLHKENADKAAAEAAAKKAAAAAAKPAASKPAAPAAGAAETK